MSAELKTRVLAAVAAEPSPARPAIHRRNALIHAAAAATSLAAFLAFAALVSDGQLLRLGGEVAPHHYLKRSGWLVVSTAGGALGIATLALWLAQGRGRSMLGRSRSWLLYGSALIPLALFLWKVGCSLAFGDAMLSWPERSGLRCLSLSLLVAVGPLLAFLTTRGSAPVHPALNGAAMGVAAGAWAWVVLDLWCPVAFVPHLLLGHMLPLFILAGTGAWLGQALLSVRVR